MNRRLSRGWQNGLRSGVVVIGAVAFGYLSLQVGFKPYLDRAQEAATADKFDPTPTPQEQEELDQWATTTPSDTSISFSNEDKL